MPIYPVPGPTGPDTEEDRRGRASERTRFRAAQAGAGPEQVQGRAGAAQGGATGLCCPVPRLTVPCVTGGASPDIRIWVSQGKDGISRDDAL